MAVGPEARIMKLEMLAIDGLFIFNFCGPLQANPWLSQHTLVG